MYDPDITAMIESYTLCIDTQNQRDNNFWPSQNFNDEKVYIMHWIQKIRGTKIVAPHITSMIKSYKLCIEYTESEGQHLWTLT